MSYVIYVGPFIRVPYAQLQRTETHLECSQKCGQPVMKLQVPPKFCSACGAPVVSVTQPLVEPQPLSHMHLPRELSEMIAAPEAFMSGEYKVQGVPVMVWLPNQGPFGKQYGQSEQPPAELDHSLIEFELKRFRKQYARVLAHVEQAFGVKPEVAYGVVPYWT